MLAAVLLDTVKLCDPKEARMSARLQGRVALKGEQILVQA